MADENDAPASLSGDALTPAEQAYFASGGEKTEGLIADGAAPAAGATEPPKTSADDTAGKPPPDGAAKPADAKPEAGKEAAKAGESAADEGDDDDGDEPKEGIVTDTRPQKTVSFHKFNRIKTKLEGEAKAARDESAKNAKELAELREKFARGDERLRLLTEALTPKEAAKAEEDDPRPDKNVDLFAYLDWQDRQIARLSQAVTSANKAVDDTRGTIQQRDAADELTRTFQRDAVTFAQTTPDFVHAYNHMFGVRMAMLEDQGYAAPEIQKIVAGEERALVQRAVQSGQSPAEMIYKMAGRFGYQRQAAPPQNGNGADAASAAAEAKPGNGVTPAAKPSVTEEIARIKAGQEAGKTLSGAGGAANELSVEGLVNMSEAEFEALLRKSPNKVNALMGA